MRKKLRRGMAAFIALLALSLPAGCAGTETLQSSQSESIRLILKYMTKDYSDQFLSGAQTAVNEYGFDLNTQSLSPEDDPARQADMLENAFETGSDAVIIAAEKTDALENVIDKGRKPNVPIIMVDTEWEKYNSFCSIKTDGRQMVKDVISELQTVSGPDGDVYILNSVCPSGETNDKEQLLLSGLTGYKGYNIKTIDYNTEFQDDLKTVIESNINFTDKNITIIALDGFSSTAAVTAIKESNQNIHLIAFGSSLDLVSEMENGRVSAMVVENAFTKGYMAVQNAVEAIKKGIRPDDILLKARIVTFENLYLPENQKLIFPLT